MTTTVVHISQPYDVYIGRAGKGTDGFFGNPHPLNKPCPLCEGTVHARGEAIAAFAQDFAQRIETDPDFRQRVLALKGKRLGCFCKPRFACHGDVYVDWLERPAAGPVATTPPAVTEIRDFKGEYAWASNFFPSPITWQGYAVATVEHGYHLDKPARDARGLFPDPAHPGQMIEKPWRQAIAEAPTPAAAKQLGRRAPMRPDWEQTRRVKVMAALLVRKFADPVLRAKLLATGTAKLIEGNWWHDTFWGVDLRTGEGQNMLGRLLMTLRTKLCTAPQAAATPTVAAASRPLVKIISGGQTGADQAGLFTAEAFGIPTGGWAPKGWLTSVGPKPALLRDRFHLEEHTGGYPQRTVANAKAADGTIRLASDFTTAGERCTLRAIQEHHKPWFDVDLKNPPPVAAARAWIQSQNIRVLNVAGNREHPQTPGTFRTACFYLRDLLVALGYDRIPRAAA
jgi:ribA/ribD-fused uncharacterized protein